MRLLKYKVHKFRSVKETDWIETDQWTCLVGLNEAGKTNLLLPLWKFNPADSSNQIDLLMDYPRDEYAQINDEQKSKPFIEVLFELDEDELNDLNSKIKKVELSQFLLVKKNYNNDFYIHVSNEKCEEKSDDLEDIIGEESFNEICQYIPKFVYYSEYGNLDSDLYLPRVVEDLGRIANLTSKERMKARTLKILFSHVNLNPNEILELGQEANTDHDSAKEIENTRQIESRKKQERFVKIESAATKLSRQFQDWWSQDDYIFKFNADGQYFRILVSDSERPLPIELESRSKGLQWFFSFFLVFLAESEDHHQNCILLLDEPGLNLHPNAQTDLIRFFDQLSEKNQLIYTTHLPFLVDHNHLDRVKAIYTENGLTKASNDLNKADRERKAIQPVNAAIGITASQSLLVGCKIVIVEGISDQFYLTMIKIYLASKGKYRPRKELVFIPVGGARGVKPVVSIIHGSNSDLPISLLDSDDTGKKLQKTLKDGFYSRDKTKVIEMDTFTGKKGSEIEDLIPADLIVRCFDQLFRPHNGIGVEDFDIKKPIVPQLIQCAAANQINLEKGWKVELSRKVKQRFISQVDEALQKKWQTLFQKLR